MKNILIIDDEEEIKKSLARALFIGHHVDFASNSVEGIELAGKNKYNLIVTDKDMEEINAGLKVIKSIRGFDNKVPIILISADINEKTKEKALEFGANAVFEKIDFMKISDWVEKNIGN